MPEKIITEDTGKIFEMAICMALGINYDGTYKYTLERAEQLKPRLAILNRLCPMARHTASKGARYDFTASDETHLSAKSAKKGVGKVAPQVIGQAQPEKFCELVGIAYTTNKDLKEYIQTNIVSLLPILVSYTFDCPTVYYNEEKNSIRLINLLRPIDDWAKYQFNWTRDWSNWNNSSTLKIIVEGKQLALLEFQIHTKSRTNMAIRWCYENFLCIFRQNLCIIHM
jgi:hypothetical protein